MQNKTDEVLVLEYQNGSQEAFNELYSRYKSVVTYYARNLFILGADNDDLIQEGLIGLMNSANTYTSDKSAFKTYATVCIKNSLYSAVKKSLADKNKPLNDSESLEVLNDVSKFSLFSISPEDEFLNKEKYDELRFKIFNSLSKNEIVVLKLYLDGLSYNEIALKTGKTVKAVDGALNRARNKIKNCVGE